MSSSLCAVLEAEYRQLAHDARKSDGFVGSFFGSADHSPEVKEAAERAVLKIRSIADSPTSLEQIRNSKEILRPLQLACETKSAKLISYALSTLQKLLSNDALSPESAEAVIAMMAHVEKVGDESVKLKSLQLALTLLQSPLHPTTEDGIAAVLGVCFRAFTQKGGKDNTVSSTAAATVRQAVSIVFSYVDVDVELERIERNQQHPEQKEEEGSPALYASQKLLEDLIAIALGAPPGWLKTPPLPRTFVIEVLDFALANSAPLFRALPDFETTLSLRISQLLQAQMQDYLDAGAAGSQLAVSSFPTFRATLKCMRTLLRFYYPQLGGRCGTLVQTVLRGLSPSQPLFQRIAVAQIMKQLLAEPSLVHYLCSTYDMQKERKLDAVNALVRGAVDTIDYALKGGNTSSGGNDTNNNIPLNVAALYQTKSNGKEWTLDAEFDTATPALQQAYLTMLAIDSLMAFLSSVERLTTAAVEEPGNNQPEDDIKVCEELINRTWRSTLLVLTMALSRWSGEELILHLLKGYQVYTQACGLMQMEEPRDAFLSALSDFALSSRSAEGTLSSVDSESPRSLGSCGGGSSSPIKGRSMSFSEEDLSSTVLSIKNVQAMRTLFNIAHRLSPILGSGWGLVLETMNTLDRLLDSPKTTTHEVASNSNDDVSGDLAILSSAASQLFESTKDMETEAVVALLSGLRDVSLKHLPHAVQMATPKMFSLNRMVEVLLFNVFRIFDLWGIFLSHVLEIISDPKPPVRAAALDALGRAIVGTLEQHRSLAHSTTESSTGGIEHMLLVALEALHNDDRERDVRAGVLRVLLSVLQRNGERLTDGWTPVFRLLAVVPGQNNPETIDLGFQCVQLIASDYMSAMPYARLSKCLQVLVLYGQQQVDVNVSLTTLSMLWNASDMLSRSGGGGGNQNTSSRNDDGSSLLVNSSGDTNADISTMNNKGGSQFSAALTPAQVEELQQMIFSALQELAQDTRPEVRNSGVRTLFAVVVSQGARLSKSLWEECLWEMLFPLLRHAFHMSATSSKQEAEAALLGKSKGQQVRLVVHHSRNTQQKQWDETVVLALGGMSRLLRAHLPAIRHLKGMDAGWEEMMVVVESAMAGGRKEVALAAINFLAVVLGSHGASSDDLITKPMWKRALRSVDVGVEAATTSGCLVPLLVRTDLIAAIGNIYTALKQRFDDEDTLQVFDWVEAFCRNPWSEDDASNLIQTIGMPPVQKAALVLLPDVSPDGHAPGLYPQYLRIMTRLLQPSHVVEQAKEEKAAALAAAVAAAAAREQEQQQQQESGRKQVNAPAPQPPPKQAQSKYALNSAFLDKVLELLVPAYDHAPSEIKASQLAEIVDALGKCMEVRYAVYSEQLWRSAAIAFNRVVSSGLPAVASVSVGRGEASLVSEATRAWSSIAEALENFLLGANTLPKQQYKRSSSSKAGSPSPSSPRHTKLPIVPILEIPPSKPPSALDRLGGSFRSKTAVASRSSKSHSEQEAAAAMSEQQQRGSTSTIEEPAVDPQQARADAELEASVLDTLSDVVLTLCGVASPAAQLRLVSIIDSGISRHPSLSIQQASQTVGSSFGHVCLRKMYALCSRGGSADDDGSRLAIARIALPLLIKRSDALLRAFTSSDSTANKPSLEEVMCVLEVLAGLTVAPEVADAALVPGDHLTQVVQALRTRADIQARGRERTHLLLLYSALCDCITCSESKVREMAKDVLQLAGAELGLGGSMQHL